MGLKYNYGSLENPPYYLTAYGIAVKHGYQGTEEEWIHEIQESAHDSSIAAAASAEAAAGSAEAAAGSADTAEAYGAGTRGGEPLDEDDPAYHNNAQYYSDHAEAYGAGTRGGEPVEEDDPAYHNNAQYFAGQAQATADGLDARLDAQDTAIATIRSQVSSPYVIAATGAAMTDQTKAYVYVGDGTGDDAGLVNGAWYYYDADEEEWIQGGTATDPTLSVAGAAADAKATGDAVGDIKSAIMHRVIFESGGYSDANGTTKNSNATRIRSSAPIPVVDLIYLEVPAGYRAYVYQLDSSYGLVTRSGWFQRLVPEELNAATQYVNITIRNQSSQSSDITSQIPTIQAGFVWKSVSNNSIEIEELYAGKSPHALSLQVYGLNADLTPSTNNKRARSAIVRAKKGDIIQVTGNYMMAVNTLVNGEIVDNSYNDHWWIFHSHYVVPRDCFLVAALAHSQSGLENGTFSDTFSDAEVAQMYTDGVLKIWRNSDIPDGYQPLDLHLLNGYYVYGDNDSPSKGYIRKNQYYYMTDYIPVRQGDKLIVYGYTVGAISLMFGYDADHAPVDNVVWDAVAKATAKQYIADEFTIPSGVRYVRISSNVNRGLTVYISASLRQYIDDICAIPDGAIEIYSGDLVVGQLRGGQSDTYLSPVNTDSETAPYRLSSSCIVGLPYGRRTKLLLRMANSNFVAAVRTGQYANHMDSLWPYWRYSGDIVDISDYDQTTYTKEQNYYNISIGLPIYQATPGTTSDTAREMSADDADIIGLKLYAINDDADIADADNQGLLNAARIMPIVYGTDSYRYTSTKAPVILHTSDPHGDEQRVRRFFDFADLIGADLAAVTGDIVTYNTYSGFGWFHRIVNNHKTLAGVCTGNHDVYIPEQTDAEVYAAMFAPIADKIGNTNGKNYYYVDIESKLLRVISVDLYQYDGQTAIGPRSKTHFLAEQLSWLVSVLSSTPSGYGIVIMEHSPQRDVLALEPNKFYQPYCDVPLYGGTDGGTSSNVDGAPIYDIVDAFIGRTTITKSYDQAGTPSSISVSADFSSVPAGIEFVAYLSGHQHVDHVCYVPNAATRQLILNVICTCPYYGGEYYSYLSDSTDIGRDIIGTQQDAFNAYVIDRLRKTVKITRIGADTTMHGAKRDYMEISYGNWTPTTATLANGSLHNSSNTTAVYTTDYVPVTSGQVAWCEVKRQLPVGHYYMYSYALYDVGKSEIKFVDYAPKNRPPHVEVSDNTAAYIRFAIVEYGYDGVAIPKRITDYSAGDVVINVC